MFEWKWDEGNRGDFGGADYFEALKRTSESPATLQATRKAVQAWADQRPMGKQDEWLERGGYEPVNWGTRSAFWGDAPGDAGKAFTHRMFNEGFRPEVGHTGFGNIAGERDWADNRSAEHKGKGWYTYADLLGGLAEGQSYSQIGEHFADSNNLWKIRPGSDVLTKIREGQKGENIEEATAGHEATVAANRVAHNLKLGQLNQEIRDLGGQVTDLTGDVTTFKQQRDDSALALENLQKRYTGELQQLKQAQASIRSNAPRAVGGAGSATSIRFARSPTRRASLLGLTRSTGPAQKLKTTAFDGL